MKKIFILLLIFLFSGKSQAISNTELFDNCLNQYKRIIGLPFYYEVAKKLKTGNNKFDIQFLMVFKGKETILPDYWSCEYYERENMVYLMPSKRISNEKLEKQRKSKKEREEKKKQGDTRKQRDLNLSIQVTKMSDELSYKIEDIRQNAIKMLETTRENDDLGRMVRECVNTTLGSKSTNSCEKLRETENYKFNFTEITIKSH